MQTGIIRATITVVMFVALSVCVHADEIGLAWVNGLGGGDDDAGFDVTVDSSGNVYCTGSFKDTADFDPGPATFDLTSAGSADAFIAKFSASGDLVWALRFGSNRNDVGRSIVVDPATNIYLAGSFMGTVDFDPGPGTFNVDASSNSDIFMSKFDSSGNFVWAKGVGGDYDDVGRSIALDSSGNVYTTGYFGYRADFDPGPGTYHLEAGSSDHDTFVSKLDNSGNFVWARQFAGSDWDSGYGLAVDSAGNVYTTGYFRDTVDFDPGPGTYNLTPFGINPDAFISKLNSAGAFVWAKHFGASYDEGGLAIALDPEGNIYTTGWFRLTVDFDPSASAFTMTSAGGYDVFINKFDSSGNFVWAKQLGGTGNDFSYGIAVDSLGNVFSSGSFEESADFNPGAGVVELISAGDNDVYISKLDNTGNYIGAKQFGGNGDDAGYSVAVDAASTIYTVGRFSSTAEFSSDPTPVELISAGGTDAFFAKLVLIEPVITVPLNEAGIAGATLLGIVTWLTLRRRIYI